MMMLNHFTYLLETPYWLLQNSSIGNKYPFAKKYELVNEIKQVKKSFEVISNKFGNLYKIIRLTLRIFPKYFEKRGKSFFKL